MATGKKYGLSAHAIKRIKLQTLIALSLWPISAVHAACTGPNSSSSIDTYTCSGSGSSFTNSISISSTYNLQFNSQVIHNDSTATTIITNSGFINNINGNVDSNSYNRAIFNEGILDLFNTGNIFAYNVVSIYPGIAILNSGTIGTLSNEGIIIGTREAINNNGTIDLLTLSNTSSIGSYFIGVVNNHNMINVFNNAGLIQTDLSSVAKGAITNDGTINTFTNTGLILATTTLGLTTSGIFNNGTWNTINNDANGTINGDDFDANYANIGGGGGISNINVGSTPILGTLNNAGSINGGVINMDGQISTLNNAQSGIITANGSPAAIYNASDAYWMGTGASITTIVNNGTITGGSGYGIGNLGGLNGGVLDIMNGGGAATIDTITNLGTITGQFGIFNNSSASINTLNNAQGANNGGALTYSGQLPIHYNIILGSNAATYGQLAVTSVTGTTSFGIYNGSMVKANSYTGVFSGIASSNLTGLSGSYSASNLIGLMGTYGSYNWQLVESAYGSTNWDLLFSNATAPDKVYSASLTEANNPALNAARVIDANPNLQNLFTALSSNREISNAASQTLPLLNGGQTFAISNNQRGINRIIQSRQEVQQGRSSGDAFFTNRYFWLKPFGSWANQNDRNGVSGYSSNAHGLILGVDKEISDADRIGLALAYSRSNVDSNSDLAPQSADINSYNAVVYGSHSLSDTTDINYQFGIGKHNISGDRSILFKNETAHVNYSSWSGHAGAGLAHTLNISEISTFTPSIRVDYTSLRDKSYRETGADILNLQVKGHTTHELVLGLDGKLTHALTDKVTLTANLGGGYDVLNEQASITSAFAGAPLATFTTKGLDPSPWTTKGGLGVVTKASSTVEITARYDFEERNGFDNQTASLKVRMAF